MNEWLAHIGVLLNQPEFVNARVVELRRANFVLGEAKDPRHLHSVNSTTARIRRVRAVTPRRCRDYANATEEVAVPDRVRGWCHTEVLGTRRLMH